MPAHPLHIGGIGRVLPQQGFLGQQAAAIDDLFGLVADAGPADLVSLPPRLYTMLADGTQVKQLTTQGKNQYPVWGVKYDNEE